MKKVLIASPVYEGMEYCINEFIMRLKNIDYLDFKIVLFDNSKSKRFFKKLRNINGIRVFYDDTDEERNMFRLISSRNKIIDYAIAKNYDYLLMMDCDVMVEDDILNKLLSHEKDVVSGIYFNYFTRNKIEKLEPVCWKKFELSEEDKEKYRKLYPEADLNWISRQLTMAETNKEELLDVSIPSAGCCLLSREAFSSGAKYGILPEHEKLIETNSITDDIQFFKQLGNFGFKIHCDTSVRCGHNVRGKYIPGKNLHPFYE
jgi:GT2 family glycosyltransferase